MVLGENSVFTYNIEIASSFLNVESVYLVSSRWYKQFRRIMASVRRLYVEGASD